MISPCLSYDDARAAIEWLERALGAEARQVHESDGGKVAHAEVWFGEDCVMLGDAGAGSVEIGGPACVYHVVDDPDPLYRRALEHGARPVVELRDTEYGSREFTVADPEGNLWSFGTYRPA